MLIPCQRDSAWAAGQIVHRRMLLRARPHSCSGPAVSPPGVPKRRNDSRSRFSGGELRSGLSLVYESSLAICTDRRMSGRSSIDVLARHITGRWNRPASPAAHRPIRYTDRPSERVLGAEFEVLGVSGWSSNTHSALSFNRCLGVLIPNVVQKR
jgi:hypothetical protein